MEAAIAGPGCRRAWRVNAIIGQPRSEDPAREDWATELENDFIDSPAVTGGDLPLD